MENGKELRRFVGHTRSVSRAVFSLDGKKVLSAGHDGSVRLWDTDSGEELLILTGHEGKVNSVVFTPDGRRAVSVGEDKTVRLWDLETGEEVGRHTGHTAEIVSVAMHPDGTRVVTGSRDQTARVWEIPPVTAIQMARGQVLLDTDTPAVPLVVKRGGRMVRVLRGRSGPATFALQSGEGYVVEPADNVRGLRVSPWEFALAEGATQRIEVRRGPEYVGEIRRYDSKEQGIIQVALSRDGRLALSGGNDNTARLWDVATGKELHKFDAHTNQVYTVGFSPDGKLGLTGGDDHQLLLWDLATCKKIRSFLGHTANVCGAVFSPDGKRIASGSWDRTIRLWDVASGQELKKLTGHTDRIMGVAFSPDGKFLASAGGYDSSVRLWDVESGKEVKKFAGHTGMVRDVKFSSDGKRILSGSADGDGMARLVGGGHGPGSVVSWSDDGRDSWSRPVPRRPPGLAGRQFVPALGPGNREAGLHIRERCTDLGEQCGFHRRRPAGSFRRSGQRPALVAIARAAGKGKALVPFPVHKFRAFQLSPGGAAVNSLGRQAQARRYRKCRCIEPRRARPSPWPLAPLRGSKPRCAFLSWAWRPRLLTTAPPGLN